MKITRNLRAISKLSLTLLLLIALIVGAVISYMFVIGYIVSLGLQLPRNPAVTIANVTFSPQNATTFNVTILNPSYSPSTTNITHILVITEDGVLHNTTIVYPLSYEIKPGNLENFTCSWDWSDHTGKTVTVHAFVEGGSGATFQAKTPFMDLRITRAYFNPAISTTRFNVTLQNSELSATYVNVTSITVTLENGAVQEITEVTPTLPYTLNPNSSETFMCQWNWTDYRSKDIGITAHTLQGYKADYDRSTPERVVLKITEAIFDVTDSTHFNVTVKNYELSSIDVDIIKINVTTKTLPNVTIQRVTPNLPKAIPPDSSVEFLCEWNWTDYQGENITITVDTLQGYTANYTQVVPLLAKLRITKVLFDVADTNHFNFTVENPELSLTSVNITKITITLEDGIAREINQTTPTLTPQYLLPQNTSVTFNCTWDWTNYRGKSVVITVYTTQGYIAFYSEVTPPPVKLTMEVDFDLANPTHFTVIVNNSKFSIDYVVVTKVEVTLTINGTLLRSIDVIPTLLFPNESVTLVCPWNWTDFPSKGVTITVYTLQGYTVDSIEFTPPWVKLTITEVLFNATDTTHFNVTVKNPGPSSISVNITSITLTVENETIQITNGVIPRLPFRLNFNTSETFKCPWNWTYHRNKTIMIKIHTFRGYVAYYFDEVTPPPVNITITKVLFSIYNMTQFNVTVQNSELSPIYANITRITVTLENGTILEITKVNATFPYILDRNDSVTFVCSWNWTLYRGKSLTVTVYQWQGYPANYIQVTPPPVILTITEVLFVNVTDTDYFNVTVENSIYSLTYDVITQVTVALENGTILETIEVIPIVILYPNSSYTFKCSWDWTEYQGINLIITAYSIRGYTASTQETP